MSHPALRVAVVDDDQSVRKALARLLRTAHFDAEGFASAGDLLRALESGSFQCLVVDLQMPEINGLDLQNHLKRNGIDIPLIFMTAYSEPGIRERCEAAGAFAFLMKPLDRLVLTNTIHAAINQWVAAPPN